MHFTPPPILDTILAKASHQHALTQKEITTILQLRQPQLLEALFSTARSIRQQYFGNHVFLYGFLYISTYCRNNCNFCFYRAQNTLSPRFRYRKAETEIIEAAIQLARSGVHLIDLTMGEDPSGEHGFHSLIRLVQAIKTAVFLPIMISPGVVPPPILAQFAVAGASWFACYQETHNPTLFQQLRPGQDYLTRLNSKHQAHQLGMLTEEGILVGVGETSHDIAHSLTEMRASNADQVRAMNFVPQQGTPMAHFPFPEPLTELILIALMRILFPDRLIPATLDVEGLAGLKRRMDAGANVVTSIVPPQQGLAGVAQSSLDIDDARRTTDNVLTILTECGLQIASHQQYQDWIKNRVLKNQELKS